ncbi:unnamed protein product [Closterium sp. Yama58-4]|nr:unnamed protein product [Closterium sp. Yama58-4]
MSVLARASRTSAVFRTACSRLASPAIAWGRLLSAGASPASASPSSAPSADASAALAGDYGAGRVPGEAAASSGRVASPSVDGEEVAKFEALASQWWDRRGPHAPLHAMSAARVAFVRDAMCRHFGLNADSARPLEGLRVLDVGCGGGLLCEPLARLGATVTGVDVTRVNTQVAAAHAARDPITRSISYKCISAEELAAQGATFDAVLSLEVSVLFLSTINRTARSFALAIAAAEYLLSIVPRGTHDWNKFITPLELALMLRRAHFQLAETRGMVFDPVSNRWSLSKDDVAVNYIAMATRVEE